MAWGVVNTYFSHTWRRLSRIERANSSIRLGEVRSPEYTGKLVVVDETLERHDNKQLTSCAEVLNGAGLGQWIASPAAWL